MGRSRVKGIMSLVLLGIAGAVKASSLLPEDPLLSEDVEQHALSENQEGLFEDNQEAVAEEDLDDELD